MGTQHEAEYVVHRRISTFSSVDSVSNQAMCLLLVRLRGGGRLYRPVSKKKHEAHQTIFSKSFNQQVYEVIFQLNWTTRAERLVHT